MSFKIECSPENVPMFRDWLSNRGGIAHWKSANLSNPGATWSTPATIAIKDIEDGARKEQLLSEHGGDENFQVPYPKVNWQMESAPAFIVTDPHEVGVTTYKTVKTIRVVLRMGDQGLSIKLTDSSSRNLRRHLARYENSTYEFGGDDGRDCFIQVPDKQIPLDEFQ